MLDALKPKNIKQAFAFAGGWKGLREWYSPFRPFNSLVPMTTTVGGTVLLLFASFFGMVAHSNAQKYDVLVRDEPAQKMELKKAFLESCSLDPAQASLKAQYAAGKTLLALPQPIDVNSPAAQSCATNKAQEYFTEEKKELSKIKTTGLTGEVLFGLIGMGLLLFPAWSFLNENFDSSEQIGKLNQRYSEAKAAPKF